MTNGIIVDTSVWIDYFNKKENDNTKLVNPFIDNDSIVTIPVIIQEVLQGIRNDSFYFLTLETFLTFKILSYNNLEISIAAASLFRFLKKNGVTIRKPNDCIIAAICINNNFSLLHNDKDFNNIAKHTSLKIYK